MIPARNVTAITRVLEWLEGSAGTATGRSRLETARRDGLLAARSAYDCDGNGRALVTTSLGKQQNMTTAEENANIENIKQALLAPIESDGAGPSSPSVRYR